MITLQPIAVHATQGKENISYEVGSLIREDLLLDPKETVLDPEVLEKGACIDLPNILVDLWGREISNIILPPMHRLNRTQGMIFLPSIPLLANSIVRAIRRNDPIHTIQKIVDAYYLKLLGEISGKQGVLARGVFGARLPNSGRLVVTPCIDRDPLWVGIHAETLKKANAKEGDFIILGRDPVIWGGSIEVLKVYPIEAATARIHPLLFNQMGMDCDGDQVFFICPNQSNPRILAELEQFHGNWIKNRARWPKTLCPNGMTDLPDWNDIETDTKNRFDEMVWSYSPREVISTGKNVRAMETAIDKPFIDKNKKISEGSNPIGQILKTCSAQMRMKRELGLVGATSRRLLVLAGNDPYLVRSAHIVSERLQQLKLDAKHGEELDAVMIFEMFERKGKWSTASITKMAETLEGAGIKKEDSTPILTYLYVELAFVTTLEDLCGDSEKRRLSIEVLRTNLRSDHPNIQEALANISVLTGIEAKEIGKQAQSNQFGLRKIFLRRFPFMALISSSREKEMIRHFWRIQNRREKDRGGLLSVIMGQTH